MGNFSESELKTKVTITYFKNIGLEQKEIILLLDNFGSLMDMLKFRKHDLKVKLDELYDEKTSSLILNSIV